MTTCPKCQTSMDDGARFCPECGHQMQDVPAAHTEAGLMTVGGMETLDDTGTRGSKSASTPALEPGAVFANRYTIEQVVGRGGMGVVYRAQDALAKKQVALKLIRPERLAGATAIDRLISEGITARDIRHPNVVAVYDVGTDDGQPFVSMEYLDGPSLRSWHRRKVQAREDVPLRVAARIMAEALDGLKAAHAAGVIHRDLKPENVILMSEPTENSAPLKILDFGIARAAGAALESGTGTGLGTPRYMAPEQITNPDAAGPSADLYSLSVLFYELLVDVLPQGHWQPPSGGRSDVPQSIDALIEKGLSNRPANRPQSATEYRKALVDAINLKGGGKTDKRKDDPSEKPWSNVNGQTIFKWAGGAALAFIALGALGLMIPDDDPCAHLSDEAYMTCKGIPIDDPDPTKVRSDIFDNDDEAERLRAELERERRASEDLKRQQDAERRRREREAEERRKREEEASRSANPYASLAGRWNLNEGTYYNVSFNSSGRFNGTGRAFDGTNLTISGSISGTSGSYSVSAPSIGITLNGRMTWDRGCHLNWQTFDPSGSMVVESGQMHVNHTPGGPCPS